jgi:hypothetical protein
MKRLIGICLFLIATLSLWGQFSLVQTGVIASKVTTSSGGSSTPPSFLTSDGHSVLWFDYTVGVTSSSNLVSQWNDQTSHHYNVSGTGSERPTLGANGITFGGGNILAAGSVSVSQPYYIWAVVRIVDWNAYEILFNFNSSSTPYIRQDGWEENPGGYGLTLDAGTALAGYGTSLNTWYIIRILANGNSSFIKLNDTSFASGAAGAGAISIFEFGNPSICAEYEIKEFLMRDQTDSGSNETAILNYFRAKYATY